MSEGVIAQAIPGKIAKWRVSSKQKFIYVCVHCHFSAHKIGIFNKLFNFYADGVTTSKMYLFVSFVILNVNNKIHSDTPSELLRLMQHARSRNCTYGKSLSNASAAHPP